MSLKTQPNHSGVPPQRGRCDDEYVVACDDWFASLGSGIDPVDVEPLDSDVLWPENALARLDQSLALFCNDDSSVDCERVPARSQHERLKPFGV
ncbi:hypothetical protein FHS27_005416 [Rhodopirellula rubra]|uniref:Uncharacterized protein n=1 Tax=Aporhodopirellula rubra TaxID=980271 RepID=A0A7W5E3L7_9BACT|nr:hypothetical protein [Aporhodopirellula rubra]MBB3209576.1 hypothetical protein [Aporhodopirellula rubra]